MKHLLIAWLAILLSACASTEWIKTAQDAKTEIFVDPESIRPHAAGKPTDWESRLYVRFLDRPRALIADGLDKLPLSERPPIDSRKCGHNFMCAYGGVIQVVFHCAPRIPKSYTTVWVAPGGRAPSQTDVMNGTETGSRRTIEPGSPLERVNDQVCSRPAAEDAVAKAAEEEARAAQQKQQEQLEANRRAWADYHVREKAKTDERDRRERLALVERQREADDLLRRANDEMRKGLHYNACDTAKTAVEKAKGTPSAGSAAATQAQICSQHERLQAQLDARRETEARQENERVRQHCVGAPRVSREWAESLARMLEVNPLSLTFNRLTFGGYGSCTMTVYHPRGVAHCQVEIGVLGAVQRIGSCR